MTNRTQPLHRRKRTAGAGSTLIELLVVIVVFLIGILAVLQIFPGGFKVLNNTRNMAMARQLARAQIETVKSRADTMPEMILQVHYAFIGSTAVSILAETDHDSNHLGHDGDGIDANGNVTDGPDTLGRWDLLVGANHIRRVIGEGGRVPAPRQVGSNFGGLMMLHFAPIAYDPAYPTLLQVYGSDMVRRDGAPGFRVREWEYYLEDVEEPAARIHLPMGPTARIYRLAMSAWINNGTVTSRRTIVDATVNVPAGTGFFADNLANYAALQAGESFVGAEWESVRVARGFVPVASFTPDEPYEFQLLDQRLGILLFNPAGRDYLEVRPGRRAPLVARVNYDVFDWRIIRDEFRIATNVPYQQRLQLGNIRVRGALRPDYKQYTGLDIPVANGSGGFETRDILLLDLDTGGVYTPDSFATDKSLGLVTFRDVDGNPANGLQMNLILPGQASATTIAAEGRPVRALYQANNEWAVQVMMAPSLYSVTYARPSVAQYYVGGSSTSGGSPLRIYFPTVDVGRKVVVGEIYYRDTGGNLHVLRDQDFVIQDGAGDPLGAHIDIRSADANAAGFDFGTYGYAVRRVKGASVAVRVLWNPGFFLLTSNPVENNENFDKWGREWRKTVVETFLQRGEN
jgi:type II secretory pathway pseudopilin PulG